MVCARRATGVETSLFVLDLVSDDSAATGVVEVALKREKRLAREEERRRSRETYLPSVNAPAERKEDQQRALGPRKKTPRLTWLPN